MSLAQPESAVVRLLPSFLLISSALAGMGDVYCPDAFCPASYECWVRAPLIILRLALNFGLRKLMGCV